MLPSSSSLDMCGAIDVDPFVGVHEVFEKRKEEKLKDSSEDFCPHSEKGVIGEGVPISCDEGEALFGTAKQHHDNGRFGCAMVILKVIGGRSQTLPHGFYELRQSIHARIGKS